MLDLKAIRRDPEAVRAALARRGDGSDARLDEALALDERRRELLPEVEGLRARQNEASQGIAQAKKAGEDAAGAIAEMQEVSRRVKALTEELAAVEAELEAALALAAQPAGPDRRRRGRDRCARWASRPDRGRRATTSSSRATLIDMEAARARVAARASPTSRATSCCSSSRSCAGRSTCWAATASSR